MCKYNQYFEIEEIKDDNKLKLASYYIDGMALYWHQNFTRSFGIRQSRSEYVDALCSRFRGQKDPLKELMELRQVGNLETYIQNFDILWNRAEVNEKSALVFFIRGLGVEIKNLAYNLAKLQQNTFTYRRNHPGHSKYPTQTTTQANQTRFNPYFTTHRIPNSSTPITLKPSQIDILPTPTQNYFNQTNTKPTRSLRSKEVGERRAKGLFLV